MNQNKQLKPYSWEIIKTKVLSQEPRAAPILAIIEKYWGDGKLTRQIAQRFIEACIMRDYVAAQKLLYGQASSDALIEADKTANAQLTRWVEQQKKVHNFVGELQGAILSIALGVALAASGF